MSDVVYKKLAAHLDDLPGGFPSTESGVELKILKKLFSPEEAALAVKLTLIPEEAYVIAHRAGENIDKVKEKLHEMSRKGLIYSIEKPGKAPLYMAAQYVVGIWEFHVNDLDEEFVRLSNEYFPYLVDADAWKASPQLRTIPVSRSLDPGHHSLPYEDAATLVKGHRRYAVAECICRKEHKLVGKGCEKPMEACLVFDTAADYYLRNGLAREIDEAETLKILEEGERAGLVVQPSNSQKAINICLCCGCCCQVLIAMKKHPDPAELFSSAYIVEVDADECVGCEVCIGRCQMEALTMNEGVVSLEQKRCIGCGLCVTTCPTKALNLKRKDIVPEVPRSNTEAAIKLAKARGKLSNAKMAKMALKSKFDRLMAASKR